MGGPENNGGGGISPSYKSWGEEQIARLLERNGIAYQYEYPLAVVDRGKVRIHYRDFRLPEYSLVVEYFGVNGDADYDEQARHKMEVYKRAGVDALFLTRVISDNYSYRSRCLSYECYYNQNP
jgi:hypothetical protein